MSNGTKDNIHQLIENIESQGYQFAIGIIKKDEKDKSKQNIDLYTNLGENPLNKLLEVLKEYKKDNKNKIKEGKEILKSMALA